MGGITGVKFCINFFLGSFQTLERFVYPPLGIALKLLFWYELQAVNKLRDIFLVCIMFQLLGLCTFKKLKVFLL